jgi:hypothetical protein
MCADHWQKLRTAIADLGMDGLVAKSGPEAVSRLVTEAESGATKTTFDPLMDAHNAILSNALDLVGIAIMAPNEDGTDRCPLCFINEGHLKGCKDEGCTWSTEPWIGYAARDAHARAKELGLIGES